MREQPGDPRPRRQQEDGRVRVREERRERQDREEDRVGEHVRATARVVALRAPRDVRASRKRRCYHDDRDDDDRDIERSSVAAGCIQPEPDREATESGLQAAVLRIRLHRKGE